MTVVDLELRDRTEVTVVNTDTETSHRCLAAAHPEPALEPLRAAIAAGAERLLRTYLDDAQRQLLEAYADRNRENS